MKFKLRDCHIQNDSFIINQTIGYLNDRTKQKKKKPAFMGQKKTDRKFVPHTKQC